jgi:putative transposase
VKRKRFSIEQMVAVLKQAEVGVPVVEVCRRVGITEQTFYRWKKKYVGLEISDWEARVPPYVGRSYVMM